MDTNEVSVYGRGTEWMDGQSGQRADRQTDRQSEHKHEQSVDWYKVSV